jgi:hypothetical protein
MRRSLLCLLLVSGLGVCRNAAAQDDHHDDKAQDHRYYDKSHKDYHQWNGDEDKHFHDYLKEKHKKDHDWQHANQREQQNYWAWRHDHP